VVMNINESHYSAIPWDKEGEGSRGVSGGPAQGGDVGTTMETQCPVEDGEFRRSSQRWAFRGQTVDAAWLLRA
jgi:hypothetical protein